MTIENIQHKLRHFNQKVTQFVEKYRQDDGYVYYDVGDESYVVRATQFGMFYNEPTVPEAEIIAFEEKHGIQLPEEYRAFLMEIANGDQNGEQTRGPWIRLYPFQHVQSKIDGDLSVPFPYTDAWDMFSDSVEDPYDAKHRNGTLSIGFGGCTIEYFLVITGSERGHIWLDDRGADNGFWPLLWVEGQISEDYGYSSNSHPATLPHVDFLSWYTRWLDAAISELDRWKGKYA